MIRSVLTLILTFGCILSLPSYAAGNFGADRHVARGVQCQQCHGANNEVKDPDKTQCIVCHDPNAVAAKTANVKHKIRMFHLTMVKTWIACYATCSTAKPKTIVSSVTTSGLRFRNLSV